MLVDPAARSQYVLMASEKVYMQMPIGQGPVSGPVPLPLRSLESIQRPAAETPIV